MMISQTIQALLRWTNKKNKQANKQTHPQTDTTENMPPCYAVAARVIMNWLTTDRYCSSWHDRGG